MMMSLLEKLAEFMENEEYVYSVVNAPISVHTKYAFF